MQRKMLYSDVLYFYVKVGMYLYLMRKFVFGCLLLSHACGHALERILIKLGRWIVYVLDYEYLSNICALLFIPENLEDLMKTTSLLPKLKSADSRKLGCDKMLHRLPSLLKFKKYFCVYCASEYDWAAHKIHYRRQKSK